MRTIRRQRLLNVLVALWAFVPAAIAGTLHRYHHYHIPVTLMVVWIVVLVILGALFFRRVPRNS